MDEARVTYILTPPQRRTSSRPLTQPGEQTDVLSSRSPVFARVSLNTPHSLAWRGWPVQANADTKQPAKVDAFDLARLWKVPEVPGWKKINSVHLAVQDFCPGEQPPTTTRGDVFAWR